MVGAEIYCVQFVSARHVHDVDRLRNGAMRFHTLNANRRRECLISMH